MALHGLVIDLDGKPDAVLFSFRVGDCIANQGPYQHGPAVHENPSMGARRRRRSARDGEELKQALGGTQGTAGARLLDPMPVDAEAAVGVP